MPAYQCRYWFLTLSCAIREDQPTLVEPICWIKGQKEKGEGGFEHWQFVLACTKKVTRKKIVTIFPGAFAEPTKSRDGSEEYVFKADTRVGESQFELGTRSIKRNSATDWDRVKQLAMAGQLSEIPSDVFVRYYGALKRICADYADPIDMVRQTTVYWGKTGTGKSYRARKEAGNYFIKNPNIKWWDGYRGEQSVVIDEFRGRIDISYLLLWLDDYKCTVEVKGGSLPLCANRIWICSNLHPRDWYPDVDSETRDALLRRLNIVEVLAWDNFRPRL